MRRLFWISVGAGAGVYAVHRVNRATAAVSEAVSPRGLARSIDNLGDALREFADEVRTAMTERELELVDALGLDGQARVVPSAHRAELLDHPTRDRRDAR